MKIIGSIITIAIIIIGIGIITYNDDSVLMKTDTGIIIETNSGINNDKLELIESELPIILVNSWIGSTNGCVAISIGIVHTGSGSGSVIEINSDSIIGSIIGNSRINQNYKSRTPRTTKN